MIKRASNISDDLEQVIVECIKGFKEKISWQQVIAEVQRKVGELYTEQGLRKHTKIAQAYRVQKALLSREKELVGRKNIQFATVQRILELEANIELLKTENNRLVEKFIVWAHNAGMYNITEDQLNEPIVINCDH